MATIGDSGSLDVTANRRHIFYLLNTMRPNQSGTALVIAKIVPVLVKHKILLDYGRLDVLKKEMISLSCNKRNNFVLLWNRASFLFDQVQRFKKGFMT
jgi:hypothetical protein